MHRRSPARHWDRPVFHLAPLTDNKWPVIGIHQRQPIQLHRHHQLRFKDNSCRACKAMHTVNSLDTNKPVTWGKISQFFTLPGRISIRFLPKGKYNYFSVILCIYFHLPEWVSRFLAHGKEFQLKHKFRLLNRLPKVLAAHYHKPLALLRIPCNNFRWAHRYKSKQILYYYFVYISLLLPLSIFYYYTIRCIHT